MLLAAIAAGTAAHAQSLDGMLRSIGSMLGKSQSADSKEAATASAPTTRQLKGRWLYRALDMQYTGDNAIASVAVASARTQLAAVGDKSGLVAGRDYVEIKDDGVLLLASGEHTAKAQYAYQPQDGKMYITVDYGGKKVSLTASVTLADGALQVMFDAAHLVAVAEQTSDQLKDNTTFQMVKSMTESYPGIMIGAVMGR